ncbi:MULTISPECIES: LeoA/HP0731 family dynamin-like GTPase [Enterobacteriaceae]|uniref:LeoA/HP0731 family dynamin-like GTPase n=3 Tax=Enterobacteriaceae TaxID=543 RepID=A0ABU6KYE2_ENTAS|nr:MULTISPECIES: LeoA/HP0731 family dynamin-like GTPase [Enterobacteriaceae]EFC9652126.1 labile enterotoxin output A [Escherichia coli]MBT1790965.1 50S ribosome-binding GTPase [Enterobacter hormaechei subsp. xiangfangensis]MDI7680032.1 50S ribosome-binding GTPase [Cronobacter sakazakii]EFH4946926.1 labile enterotoxin output A [Escherichia coli]EFN4084066.1 labile enterotoxin output A [Escherichia coli]
MNETLNTFNAQQTHAVKLLQKLETFLQQGALAGVPIDPALSGKIHNAIASLADEKLKVALIGGFSEGKTSIAAAWMEKLDKTSMKISHQESSNEVKVYEVGQDFVLIDTPGLFGFKEQENDDTHAIEKYKDITKKYVSEAHLVLYVMNPTNPIKESHQEDLTWLFRTLDLLPRSIFVLSRFDEVADVEDEDDYEHNLNIKRANVAKRLSEMISLTAQEQADLSIVGVAANPFDLGTEHWLANSEQFKSLSHISSLQAATTEKIQHSGGNMALANDMRSSVIRDILHNQLPVAIDNDEKISQEVLKLDSLYSRMKTELAQADREIENTVINLREFVIRYFSDLILQAQGCSMETFSEFFEREVGDDGIIVSMRLENEFSRQIQPIEINMEKMQLSFDTEVNQFNTTIKAFGKQGINHVLKGNLINNKTVIGARDGIVGMGKLFGKDFGNALKFKPWGATKLAKGANGALIVVGIALEAWDSYQQYQREREFQEAIAGMIQNFKLQRENLKELIGKTQFKEQFFGDLKSNARELEASLNASRESQQRFQAWRTMAETIEDELNSELPD